MREASIWRPDGGEKYILARRIRLISARDSDDYHRIEIFIVAARRRLIEGNEMVAMT